MDHKYSDYIPRLKFSKMHGLGNDFMVIDGVTQNVHINPSKIVKWANRHTGIGFDQLLLIEPPYDPEIDFHYRIFNADGSEVSQCGNGARCLAKFVHLKGLAHRQTINVSTKSGLLNLKFLDKKTIEVDMGCPTFEPDKIPLKATKKEQHYLFRLGSETVMASGVNVGNPHLVILVDDINTAEVEKIGSLLEHHERLTEGANIGFMEIVSKDEIRLRVFERGTGETQACGSGACAAVAVGIMQGLLNENVLVNLKGGQLKISWAGDDKPLFMAGNAEHVFDGQINLHD